MEKNELYNRFTQKKPNGDLYCSINNAYSYAANWWFSRKIISNACCYPLSEGGGIASNSHIMSYFGNKEKEGGGVNLALLEGD